MLLLRRTRRLLTVQRDPHLGLEVAVSELPQSEGLPGCALQQAEAHADGVLGREAGRVDVSAGKEAEDKFHSQGTHDGVHHYSKEDSFLQA